MRVNVVGSPALNASRLANVKVPAGVPPDVGAVATGLDQESRPDRVPADRDVEIVGDVGLVDGAAAANLRAAGIERVQHLARRARGWRMRTTCPPTATASESR